jgi:beta-mannosidase
VNRVPLETGWYLLESIGEDWRWRGLERETSRVGGGAFANPRPIPARVPGSVQHDLLRAGEISDPNRGLESRHCEWVSQRRWVYRTTLRIPEDWTHHRVFLRFDGADPGADIFVDGEQCGELEDVGQRLSLELETRAGAEHRLVVALREPPLESGQLGRTSQTRSLKPRMGYWWDFATRLIPLSLGAVTLEATGLARLQNVFVRSELEADHRSARVTLEAHVDGDVEEEAMLHVEILEGDGQVVARSRVARVQRAPGAAEVLTVTLELPNPRLWTCNGLGKPELYRCRAHLEVGGECSDTFETRFGIRRVEFHHNPGGSLEAEPYTVVVNGQPVFARGWNWVPADLMTGRADLEPRMRHLLGLARDAGANLIRVNGVGGVESGLFYELCDELGLMVWQEFPLSSSGLDNVPPSDAVFLVRLERVAPELIRRVRQHPSLVLWGGGNELTDESRRPATRDAPALRVLEAAVRVHDPDRAFRPTSPFGPVYDLDDRVALERPDDLHDVHGPWHYRGVTNSYVPFNASTALFHSEFGAQGASHRRSLERAMRQPWAMDESNPEVSHRGSWWLMRHRVEEAFGRIHDLETYWRCSQVLQAQLVGYGVASNRRRAPRCSGALLWQLNEPWENAHNTSAVDFFGRPKMAYRAARAAFAPVAASLRFSSHAVTDDVLRAVPFVVSDLPWRGMLQLKALDLNGRIWRDAAVQIGVHGVIALPALEWSWTQGEITVLRMELFGDEHLVHSSDTLFSRADPPVFAPLLNVPRATLEVRQRGRRLQLENVSRVAALFVNLDAVDDDVWLRAEADFFTLLPGEIREYEVIVDFQHAPRSSVALGLEGLNLEARVLDWAVSS